MPNFSMRDSENRHRSIYLLPNAFTTAALFEGFYAVVQAMNNRFEVAAIAIFVAMVLDGIDVYKRQVQLGHADLVRLGLAHHAVEGLGEIAEGDVHVLARQAPGQVGVGDRGRRVGGRAHRRAVRLHRFHVCLLYTSRHVGRRHQHQRLAPQVAPDAGLGQREQRMHQQRAVQFLSLIHI